MKAGKMLLTLTLAGAGAKLLARARREQAPYSFSKSVVLISGGSRGLGLVIGRLLAAEGARIAVFARDANELDRAVADLEEHGAEAFAIDGDVGSEQDAKGAVEQVIARWGRLDVLINVAGIIQVGPWEQMTKADFEQAMDVHLWGPYYTMQAAIPQMRQQHEGRIVNIASIGGKVAVPHLLPYSTSKFALVGLSDGLRAELAKEHIHVTTVAPGLMRTGSAINAQFKGQQEKEYALFLPLGSLPLTTISADVAARQIVEAARHKQPELTISIQARLLVLANALAPNLFARLMQLVSMALPRPGDADGLRNQSGWDSRTAVSDTPLSVPTYSAAARNNELPDQSPS